MAAQYAPRGFGRKFPFLKAIPVADRLPELPEPGTPGLYLMGGADSWLRQRTIHHCIRHHLPEDDREASFRLRQLHGATASGDQILTAARAVGFGGGPVVVVRDGFRLAQPPAGDKSPALLVELIERPPARAVLILEWEKDPDRRKLKGKIETALAEGARAGRIRAFDCDPPLERAVAGWVQREARSLGCTLPKGGADLLADRFGQDLRRQHNELEKLRVYCDEPNPTLEDMHALLGGGTARDRFRFTNAVEEGDPAKALRLLDLLLAEGESPQMLLPLLYNIAVRIEIARIAALDDQSLAELLPVPRPVASRINRRARQFDKKTLRAILSGIADMDFRLKSTQAPPRVVFAGIILRLAGPG